MLARQRERPLLVLLAASNDDTGGRWTKTGRGTRDVVGQVLGVAWIFQSETARDGAVGRASRRDDALRSRGAPRARAARHVRLHQVSAPHPHFILTSPSLATRGHCHFAMMLTLQLQRVRQRVGLPRRWQRRRARRLRPIRRLAIRRRHLCCACNPCGGAAPLRRRRASAVPSVGSARWAHTAAGAASFL